MKKTILTLGLLVALPLAIFSQHSISGKVSDKQTGKALQGAHIIIKNTFKSTTTNKNGEFFVNKLNDGSYILNVSFMGYETYKQKINLAKNIKLDIKLLSKTILEEEVIITATRASEKSPTAFKNISKEKIKSDNLGQDIPFLLETTPSVVVTSDAGAGVGYTGLRIRGTDMTRINVTINGIPLNDPESHGVFWVNMPDFASSIDNMQIQRGVGTSTNGAAAFGASINIQTLKLQSKAYAEINSSAGSFNTFKNNVSFGTGLINGKYSFDGRLSKISSDGFVDRAFSDLKSYYFSGAYFGKKSILKFITFSGKEKTYQSWYGIPKDSLETNRTYNPYTYKNETDNYKQDHYQLLYSKEISEYLHFNTALFFIHGEGYYEQYKKGREYSDYLLDDVIIGQDTITETDLIQQKWLDNNFYGITYSLNYKKHNVDATLGGALNEYDGDHFGEVIWAQFASNGIKDHKWYKNTGTKKDFNIFGKINYSLSEKINLYGDIQFRSINYDIKGIHDDLRDLTQDHKFNFLNPKAGIFYDINENQNAYFSFAVSNREPNRSNFRDADPGVLPKSEKLFDYELGYSFSLANFIIEANLFYMDYKDQLVLTGEINNVGAAIMANVPNSYRTGVEIATGIKFLEKFRWDVNATFSENKIKNFTEYVDNWSSPYLQIS
ncbi:MAG: TonB-dependent receptor, partial [Bacteroidales bacterium]|nr:TonB-dependent receptor [Bacteroidales bacterium]